MITNDDYYQLTFTGLFRMSKKKTIRVICKCGTGITFVMPGELLDAEAYPIIICSCGQEYTIYEDKLVRKQDFKTVEGILLPKVIKKKPIQPSAKD